MGFAENFIQAFVQGSQIRQRQEQLAQQAEASKLEREVLQQRIRQLKLEEGLKAWDLKDRQHAILSGRPRSSYQQNAPGESERLGLESLIGGVQTAVPGASPISNQLTDPWGDTVAGYEGDQQMPSFPAAGMARQQVVLPQTEYPAIPGLGVSGMSRSAEPLEDMLFKMRAEAEAKYAGRPGTMRFGGTMRGDQVPQGGKDHLGQAIDPRQYYRTQILPDGEILYLPTVPPGGGMGQTRESLSRAMFDGRPYASLTPPEQQQVLAAEVERGGEVAGTNTAARAKAESEAPMSTAQRFNALTELQTKWRSAEAPLREMERQYNLMKVGLARFRGGDKVGGSEAVRITFEKILDPTSVVREGEYARQGLGLSLVNRLEGLYQKYAVGGGEIPENVLSEMTETARQFVEGMKDWNNLEREKLTGTARDFGLDERRIFGGSGPAPTQAAPRSGGSGPVYDKVPDPNAPGGYRYVQRQR